MASTLLTIAAGDTGIEKDSGTLPDGQSLAVRGAVFFEAFDDETFLVFIDNPFAYFSIFSGGGGILINGGDLEFLTASLSLDTWYDYYVLSDATGMYAGVRPAAGSWEDISIDATPSGTVSDISFGSHSGAGNGTVAVNALEMWHTSLPTIAALKSACDGPTLTGTFFRNSGEVPANFHVDGSVLGENWTRVEGSIGSSAEMRYAAAAAGARAARNNLLTGRLPHLRM